MDEFQLTITMEEPEELNPKQSIQTPASTPPPPTYSSATSPDKQFSSKSKIKTNTSSPKMTEKQNSHQAS